MARLTINAINKALEANGFEGVVLYKGKGYFYFWEGEAINWRSSSVYVYRLTDLTLEQWLQEAKNFKENAF